MISAIDNNKNRYFNRVQAVQFQTERSYSAEFQQDLLNKTLARSAAYAPEQTTEHGLGSLLSYNRKYGMTKGEFNLLHPDITDGKKAQSLDFLV